MGETDKTFTEEEVAKHNEDKDCWIILGEPGQKKVYDVTKFLDDHPGGPEIILDLAGHDGNDEFEDIGHSKDAKAMLDKFYIGKLDEKSVMKKFRKNACMA